MRDVAAQQLSHRCADTSPPNCRIPQTDSAGKPVGAKRVRSNMTANPVAVAEPRSGGLQHRKMYIDGEWVDAASGETFETINPYTGEAWATAPLAGAADVRKAVEAARRALSGPWGSMSAAHRGDLIRRLAALIEPHADELARIETTDNGKVIRETRGQMAGLPATYEFFAGAADKISGPPSPRPRRTSSPTPAASPSASSQPSCRGTARCSCSRASSRPLSPRDAPSSPNRQSRRPRRPWSSPDSSTKPASRRESSTWSPAPARRVPH